MGRQKLHYCVRAAFLAVIFFASQLSFGYGRQVFLNETSGVTTQVKWKASAFPLTYHYYCPNAAVSNCPKCINANCAGGDIMTETEFLDDVAKATSPKGAMTYLEEALTGQLDLFATFDTGNRNGVSQEWNLSGSTSSPNGYNSILFSSAVPTGYGNSLGSTVVGLTMSWYSTTTGELIETDVQLNDKVFKFVNGSTATSGTSINIRDVLSHELGHALGLDHSQTLTSTMFPTAANGQRSLTGDDKAGLRAIYSGIYSGVGTLQGTVRSGTTFLFGAYVTAIEMSASSSAVPVVASAISDLNGQFQIAGLPEGQYFIFVEPYKLGSYLGSYYASTNQLNKSMNSFSAKGFVPASGRPILVHVAGNQVTSWLNISIEDLLNTAEAEEAQGNSLPSTSGSQSNHVYGDRIAGTLSVAAESDYYKVVPSGTTLYARVIANSVYAAADVSVSVYQGDGDEMDSEAGEGDCTTSKRTDISTDVEVAEGVYDADVFCTGLTAGGTAYVRVTGSARACNTTNFPSPADTVCSGNPSIYYALMLSSHAAGTPQLTSYTDQLSGAAPDGFIVSLGPVGIAPNCAELSDAVKAQLWDPKFCESSGGGCGCGTIGKPFTMDDFKGLMVNIGLALLCFFITRALKVRARKRS